MDEYINYIENYLLEICENTDISRRLSAIPQIVRIGCGGHLPRIRMRG